MHASPHPMTHDSRLRLVFSDTVVSCIVAADVTLEEIAYRCAAVAERRLSEPIAVVVTVGWHGD